MAVRLFIALTICFTLSAIRATAQTSEDAAARERVTAYAQQIHDYVWTLPEEDGFILLYNVNYYPRRNGNRVVFDGVQPYVVYGTVRGVPYSLSSYSNGKEMTFERYQQLTLAQRAEVANMYLYPGHGQRISMRYGMSCATFLTECLRQGFPDEDLPVLRGVGTFLYENRWKRHMTFGKHGRKDYPDLLPGDFLRVSDHVMLVMENDPEACELTIMDQTAPNSSASLCENLTDVTVTLIHRGKPTVLEARRLCMECPACLSGTTGTRLGRFSYDELGDLGYMAVFVGY